MEETQNTGAESTKMNAETTVSSVNKVTLKKSELATLKGLGFNNADIAKKFNITSAECVTALKHFGLLKERSLSTSNKSYIIEYVDDVNI